MKSTLPELVGSDGLFVDGDWVESKDQDPDGDTRLVQLADVGDGEFLDKSSRFMTSSKADTLRCTRLKKGDLLIARMPDPLGRACIFPGATMPCVTVVDVAILRPDPRRAFVPWLKHAINSPDFRNQIATQVTGTTRQRISRGNLAKLVLDLPPLPEQKRIAAILDKADEVRRKRAETIRLTEELLKSAFLEMFGHPVTNPKGWPVKKLGDLVEFVGGGTPARARPEYFSGTNCWATSKDIRGERLLDTQEHVTDEAIRQSATKLVEPGTLLVVVKSKVLMHRLPICVADVPVCFGQDLKGLVAKQPGSTEFLLRAIKLSERTLLDRARGANTEGLTLDHLRDVNVPWPKQELRSAYEGVVARSRTLLRLLRAREDASLADSLIQRAFSGRL